MHDLFDPALYAAVRRPLLEAETLPPACYTAPEFFGREVERIFRPAWRFVGREDEIARAGDYRTLDSFAGPVVVVRGSDGRLRAFLNACRHRGTQIAAGCGNRAAFACPYHAWTYRLDGALVAAPGMERTKGFDRARYGLVPVPLESWGGFLWVNAHPGARPLRHALGDLAEQLAPWRCEDLVCARRIEFEVACNWKLLIENAMEEFHTGTVHRASLGQQQGEAVATRGDWDALFIAQDTTVAVLPGEASPFPPIPGLAGRPARGTYFTALYPCLQLALTQDCVWWLDMWPTGPGRTRLVAGFCFPRATAARPDFAETVRRYYRRWETSIGEDNAIGEIQQLGLAATARPPGRFSWKEHHVHKLANWVLDRVLDGPR